MREVISTREDAQAVLEGGVGLLEARATFYDDVWLAIPENRDIARKRA